VALKFNPACGRVMRGVRLLVLLNPRRKLASINGARLFANPTPAFHPGAALRDILHGSL
jgi:hypothetical protein